MLVPVVIVQEYWFQKYKARQDVKKYPPSIPKKKLLSADGSKPQTQTPFSGLCKYDPNRQTKLQFTDAHRLATSDDGGGRGQAPHGYAQSDCSSPSICCSRASCFPTRSSLTPYNRPHTLGGTPPRLLLPGHQPAPRDRTSLARPPGDGLSRTRAGSLRCGSRMHGDTSSHAGIVP